MSMVPESGQGAPEAEMGIKLEISKEEGELRELFKEEDWQKEISKIKEMLRDGEGITLASNMKKFDENKFDAEIKINDEEWQKVESNVKETYEPVDFLNFAASMKIVDPERFKGMQTVLEERFDKVVEDVGRAGVNENYFKIYESGKLVYGKKFVDAVPLDWTKIMKTIDDNLLNGEISAKKFHDERLNSDEVVSIAAGAQRNKPENMSDIEIDESTYYDFRDDIMKKLAKGETIRAFSLFVRSKGLKVKK